MDLHEAQQAGGGGGPVGSPHEINNLKQQLQDTKKKLEVAEKQVEEKSKLCTELENKMKVIITNKAFLKMFWPYRYMLGFFYSKVLFFKRAFCGHSTNVWPKTPCFRIAGYKYHKGKVVRISWIQRHLRKQPLTVTPLTWRNSRRSM